MSTVLLQCCNGAAQIVKCSCDHVMETSCNDVFVVGIICTTIVLVALIAKWAVWSWKDAEVSSKEKERKDTREKEKEESYRKQRAELLNKKLSALSGDEYVTALDEAINMYSEPAATDKNE